MDPVSPVLPECPSLKNHEIVLGENQPQYVPLPALCQTVTVKDNVMSGPFVNDIRQANYVITRWQLTDEEIARIVATRSLYVSTWKARGDFFNPIAVSTEPPIQPDDVTITPTEQLVQEPERVTAIQDTDSEGN